MYSVIIIGNNSFINKKKISPLSLLKIDDVGTDIISTQMAAIRRLKKYEIIFVGDSLSNKLQKKWYKNYIYINANTKNTGHSLRMGLEKAKYCKIIIIHDNVIVCPSFFSFLNKDKNYIFAQGNKKSTKNNVGCCIYNGIVQQLFYDLPNKWAQIVYLGNGAVDKIKKLACSDSTNCDYKFDFEIYNEVMQDPEHQFNVSFKKTIIINSEKDLKEAKEYIYEGNFSDPKKSDRNRN